MQDRLRLQVVKGAKWAFFSSIAVRACQMITTMVLAKLLVPGDFGLFTLVSIVTNAMAIFPEIGFARVLIYRQDDIRSTANTSLTLSLVTGTALAAAVILSAEPIARLFSAPAMIGPVRVMALTLIVSSLSYVPMALLDRELMFRQAASSEVAGWVVYTATSIILAMMGFGVWSMVIGYAGMTVVIAIVLWSVSPWRPRFEFRLDESRVIVSYGKHLVVGVLAAFVFMQIDKAAVGKWLGVTALGFYGIALTVCSLPATNLTNVVNRVMFPTYSKLRDNLGEIRRIYLTTVKHLSVAGFLATAAMLTLPGPLILAIYGPRWEPAIPLFTVFAFYGVIRTIGATADAVFMATGNPVYVRRTRTIQLSLGATLVYPIAMRYGVIGVAILFTCAYLAGMLYGLRTAQRILDITPSGWFAALRTSAISAAAATGSARLLAGLATTPWARIALLLIVLVGVFVSCACLLDRDMLGEMRSILSRPKEVTAS